MVLMVTGGAANAKEGLLAEYNRITKPANYDPRHNSAELFEKAANAYVPRPQSIPRLCDYWGLSRKQRSDLQDWLESNEECIRYFTLAADRKYYWKQYQAKNNEMKDLGFLELDRFTDMAKLLFWQAEKIADQGNVTGAFELLTSAYKVGSQFQSPKILISQLVGTAVCRASFAAALQIIQNVDVGSVSLLRYQQKLMVLLESGPVEISYSEGEKLYALESINRSFTDDGQGNGLLIPKQLVKELENPYYPDVSLKEARQIAYKHPDKQETTNLLEKYRERMNIIRKETPWALHQRGTDYTKEAEGLTEKAYILNVSVSGMLYSVNHIYNAFADALLVTLASSCYRSDKGDYPKNLDVLVKNGYLQTLPRDPYSDEPLVYRRTGGSFVLYSVGGNFKDDGGKHVGWSSEKEGDFVFWPVQRVALN